MQKATLFLLFVLIHTIAGHAQIIYRDDGRKEDSLTVMQWFARTRMLTDSLQSKGVIVHQVDLLEKQGNVFLLIDGRFDVWSWQKEGHHWKNLYKGHHHGYNYLSKKWMQKGEIYSFGGYGFWLKHGHVIHFNILDSQWEFHQESSQMPFGPAFIRNDTLTVIADSLYQYNLNKHDLISITPNTSFFTGQVEKPLGMIETKDYLLLADDGSIMYKPTTELYTSNSVKNFPIYSHRIITSCLWIHQNSIDVFTRDLFRINRYNFDQEIKLFQKSNSTVTDSHRSHATWIFFGLGMPLLIIFYIFQKNKQAIPESKLLTQSPPSEQIRQKLLSRAGKVITVEQLDELFGLSQSMPRDTQRFKRFQYIRDTNESYQTLTGRQLIVRQRDPEDKRRFVYFIQE